MIKADLQQGVTISTPSPPRAGQRRHPLGSPLPPHLLLPPHRHHPPPCCLPGRWRDQPHPGQQAHGLSPDCSRGDQPAILPNNHAQHPLRLLATSCTSQIRHPGFSTFLYESVKILAPLTPMSSHKAEQWSIAKTLPEAQRTQKLTPGLGLSLATT